MHRAQLDLARAAGELADDGGDDGAGRLAGTKVLKGRRIATGVPNEA
jgi:hypothetical protein